MNTSKGMWVYRASLLVIIFAFLYTYFDRYTNGYWGGAGLGVSMGVGMFLLGACIISIILRVIAQIMSPKFTRWWDVLSLVLLLVISSLVYPLADTLISSMYASNMPTFLIYPLSWFFDNPAYVILVVPLFSLILLILTFRSQQTSNITQ